MATTLLLNQMFFLTWQTNARLVGSWNVKNDSFRNVALRDVLYNNSLE